MKTIPLQNMRTLIRYRSTNLWYDPGDPKRQKYRRRPDGTFYPASVGRRGAAARKRAALLTRGRAATRIRTARDRAVRLQRENPYLEVEVTDDGTLITREYHASAGLLIRSERWGSSPTEWSRLARLKTPTGDRLAWTPITPKLARKLISQRPLRRLVPIEVEAWLADLRAGDPAISDEPVHRSLAELKRELMSG